MIDPSSQKAAELLVAEIEEWLICVNYEDRFAWYRWSCQKQVENS